MKLDTWGTGLYNVFMTQLTDSEVKQYMRYLGIAPEFIPKVYRELYGLKKYVYDPKKKITQDILNYILKGNEIEDRILYALFHLIISREGFEKLVRFYKHDIFELLKIKKNSINVLTRQENQLRRNLEQLDEIYREKIAKQSGKLGAMKEKLEEVQTDYKQSIKQIQKLNKKIDELEQIIREKDVKIKHQQIEIDRFITGEFNQFVANKKIAYLNELRDILQDKNANYIYKTFKTLLDMTMALAYKYEDLTDFNTIKTRCGKYKTCIPNTYNIPKKVIETYRQLYNTEPDTEIVEQVYLLSSHNRLNDMIDKILCEEGLSEKL